MAELTIEQIIEKAKDDIQHHRTIDWVRQHKDPKVALLAAEYDKGQKNLLDWVKFHQHPECKAWHAKEFGY